MDNGAGWIKTLDFDNIGVMELIEYIKFPLECVEGFPIVLIDFNGSNTIAVFLGAQIDSTIKI